MRKVILLGTLLILAASSPGQQTPPTPTSPQEEYLRKSRSQKTGAWLLIGLGTVVFVSSAANNINSMFDAEAQTHDAFYIASAASVAGAVYLFVAAARNRRKAEGTSITPSVQMDSAPVPVPGGMSARSYPALGITVKL